MKVIIVAVIGFLAHVPYVLASGPVGVWITKDGRSLVNIAPCGQGVELCSKIIWLKKPFNDRGEPLRDKLNIDPKLRRRPILGMPILINLRPGEEGRWDGRVYNPEDGKTYRAQVTPKGQSRLHVKGCAKVLFSWVCREQLWKRASDEMLKASNGMPLEPQLSGR